MLCCGRFVYRSEANHPSVYLVSLVSQLVPLSSLHIKMPQRLRKLSLYEKWSSRNLFPHHILCYQEIRKYGEALWRKHSCSVHLYQSCNLHWNHLTLRVWENDFLLQRELRPHDGTVEWRCKIILLR